MIFLRDFYDKDRKVNHSHRWVWYVHLISYSYIAFVYYFTDLKEKESSQTTKMWIPLDIILTINITLYQIFYNYIQKVENINNTDEHAHKEDGSYNQSLIKLQDDSKYYKPPPLEMSVFHEFMEKQYGHEKEEKETKKKDKKIVRFSIN